MEGKRIMITVGTDSYNKVYHGYGMTLYFNRRNTWDDGRLLLVDEARKAVYTASAAEAIEAAGDESDNAPTWQEVAETMLDVAKENAALSDYLRRYGDLRQDIVTSMSRAGLLDDPAKLRRFMKTC